MALMNGLSHCTRLYEELHSLDLKIRLKPTYYTFICFIALNLNIIERRERGKERGEEREKMNTV